MFKFFKKEGDEPAGLPAEAGNKSMARGLLFGVGGAIVLVAIIVVLIFGNSWWGKKTPPVATTDAVAKLKVIIITKKDCVDCFNINLLTDALKQNKANITKQDTLYLGDKNADNLVKKYNITKVPTMLVTGDLETNSNLKSIWQAMGEIVDKTFIFRQVIPPFIDVASGQLKGKLQVTFLTDSSCKDCYDVNLHEVALKNLGIEVKDKKTVDVSSDEGKALVLKYKIDKAPTILISGEVSEYPNLVQLWPDYGRVADDGTHIFTKLDVMGTYKDLTKNKVVPVTLSASQAQ